MREFIEDCQTLIDMAQHLGWNWTHSTRKTERLMVREYQKIPVGGGLQEYAKKDAKYKRQSASRTRSEEHLESRKSMNQQKKGQVSVGETCRIRSTRSPCIFNRRRSNKKEEATVSRIYSKITYRVDKVSQTHTSLLDTSANSSTGQDLASACSVNKWQCVVQTTAHFLQEFCWYATSGLGRGSTGRQE